MTGYDLKRLVDTVLVWCDVYNIRHDTMQPRVRSTWWEALQKYEFDDVQLAMDNAHTHQRRSNDPGRMFNLAQVQNALEAILREKAERERAEAAAHICDSEPANPDIPHHYALTERQENRVAAGSDPLSRLALQWEAEEQNRRRSMTQTESRSRWKAFFAALDEHDGIG